MPFVMPVAKAIEPRLLLPLDVEIDGALESVFDRIQSTFGRLDFVLHSIAFCPKQDFHRRVTDCSREGFARAMDVSVHSFIRMARLAEPLMQAGGCLLTVSHYGAEKVLDRYNIMGPVKAALEGTPYTVVGLQDSLQAMELVQELHPCAILLDVMMPHVNGWQLLHQLKENPATASIPVMMITVLTEPTTGYVLGADAYLMKPFKTNVLLNTLRHLLASQTGHAQTAEREAQRV